ELDAVGPGEEEIEEGGDGVLLAERRGGGRGEAGAGRLGVFGLEEEGDPAAAESGDGLDAGHAGEAEVDDAGGAGGVDEDVHGVDIAVDDAGGVEGGEGVEDGGADGGEFA